MATPAPAPQKRTVKVVKKKELEEINKEATNEKAEPVLSGKERERLITEKFQAQVKEAQQERLRKEDEMRRRFLHGPEKGF